MKNISKFPSFVILLFAFITIIGCDSDDPEPVNEEELITTLTVTFVDRGDSNETIVATFTDLDGPGGNDPVITDPVTLQANRSYSVVVAFLNETESPAENITEEVSEESDEHQVFFVPSSGLNFSYLYSDKDANDLPLGLLGFVNIGEASTGTLEIALIHEPVKTAQGVADGDPTNAGGETDINVSFNLVIQ
ncbi:MAG: hypothetical protein ACJAXB_000985 [Candidatus Endobugula sp.]|jgi:hypothetical protein